MHTTPRTPTGVPGRRACWIGGPGVTGGGPGRRAHCIEGLGVTRRAVGWEGSRDIVPVGLEGATVGRCAQSLDARARGSRNVVPVGTVRWARGHGWWSRASRPLDRRAGESRGAPLDGRGHATSCRGDWRGPQLGVTPKVFQGLAPAGQEGRGVTRRAIGWEWSRDVMVGLEGATVGGRAQSLDVRGSRGVVPVGTVGVAPVGWEGATVARRTC